MADITIQATGSQLSKATVVAAGGLTSSGSVTGDNEGYNTSSEPWTALAPDPTSRQAGCFATISGLLYPAMGTSDSGPVSLAELFSLAENQWTTLVPAPLAQVNPGSATVNSLLYCFGGSNNGAAGQGTVYSNVQIYHPLFQTVAVVSSAYLLAVGIAPGMLATAYGAALGTAEFYVSSGDGTVSAETVQIGAVAPGVFQLDASGLVAADVLTVSGTTQTYGDVFSISGSGAVVAQPNRARVDRRVDVFDSVLAPGFRRQERRT